MDAHFIYLEKRIEILPNGSLNLDLRDNYTVLERFFISAISR